MSTTNATPDPNNPIVFLDKAVEIARLNGHQVDGWMMSAAAAGGVIAWLYRDDDEGQWSLFDEVEEKKTALEAAKWVLAAAAQL